MTILDKFIGVIPLLAGVYAVLLGYRVMHLNPRDKKRSDEWYNKYGKMMKLLGPPMIVGSIALLLFEFIF